MERLSETIRNDIPVSDGTRPQRADALRNQAAIVAAARTVFTTDGVSAPPKQIADAAGVGVGTLYRHFPNRAELVKAVFCSEIDSCADAAAPLLAAHEPFVALEQWVARFKAFSTAKHGLIEAIDSTDISLQGMPNYAMERFTVALAALLDAGVRAGETRPDVSPRELFYALARLYRPMDGADPGAGDRLVAILLEGLRAPGALSRDPGA